MTTIVNTLRGAEVTEIMSEYIKRFDPLDEVTIDESNYVASLFGAAYELELVGDSDVERFQGRLLELLSYVTFKYTKGESSSVMEDVAKRFAESSLYLIGLTLRSEPSRSDALDKLLRSNLNTLYEDGVVIATKLLSDSKKRFNAIVKAFVTCGNEALSSTLKSTIKIYLQKYSRAAKFFAHELPTMIEYDLYNPIESGVGIEYINDYLLRLSIENSFLKLFSGDELLSLFKAFDNEYKDSLFNLFEVTLKNSVAAVLLGKTAGTLKITDEDTDALEDIISSLDENEVYDAVCSLLLGLDCESGIVKAYILADTSKLVNLLKGSGVVISKEEEDIGELRVKMTPKMDDSQFSLLLEELEDCGNKAGFIKNEFRSLWDIHDILSGDHLTVEEAYEYFDLLQVIELASLFCFCKQSDVLPLIEDYLDARGDIRSINVRKYSHYIKFI